MNQEHFTPTKNQFHNHLQALINKTITLNQLECIRFAWIIQHLELYQEKPLPTEPIDMGNVTAVKFLEMKKAWKYYTEKVEAENRSNAWWLKKAEKFFLNNDYDEGLRLFAKYENYEKKVEVEAKLEDEEVSPFIKELEKDTKKNIEQVSLCPF